MAERMKGEKRALAKPQLKLKPSASKKNVNKREVEVDQTKNVAKKQRVHPYTRQEERKMSQNKRKMSQDERKMSQDERKMSLLSSRLSSEEKKLREQGTSVLDMATYLKIMGEALLVIGSHLKAQEGPVPVTPVMTVLLDTLLCGLNVLMGLTQKVPELNCIPPDTLQSLFKSVHILIPGLFKEISFKQ